jgi:hypothetical protein
MSFVLVKASDWHVIGCYRLSATRIQLVDLPETTANGVHYLAGN